MATRKGSDTNAGTGRSDPGAAKPSRRERFAQRAGKFVGGDEIRTGADASREAFGNAFSAETARYHETFNQARSRMGLTPEQIAQSGNTYRLETFIYGVLFVFGFTSGILSLLFKLIYSDVVVSLAVLCVSIALGGTMAFRAAFRNWQIRNAQLGGLQIFLHSPGEWMPRKVYAEQFMSREVATQGTSRRPVRRG